MMNCDFFALKKATVATENLVAKVAKHISVPRVCEDFPVFRVQNISRPFLAKLQSP